MLSPRLGLGLGSGTNLLGVPPPRLLTAASLSVGSWECLEKGGRGMLCLCSPVPGLGGGTGAGGWLWVLLAAPCTSPGLVFGALWVLGCLILPFSALCLVFVSFYLAPDGLSHGREFFILPTPPSPST